MNAADLFSGVTGRLIGAYAVLVLVAIIRLRVTNPKNIPSVSISLGIAFTFVGIRAKPLKVEPLAVQVVEAVLQGVPHPWLQWLVPGRSVRVLVGQIIENTAAKQTVAGRRKRFRKALHERMKTQGWFEAPGRRPYTFERG